MTLPDREIPAGISSNEDIPATISEILKARRAVSLEMAELQARVEACRMKIEHVDFVLDFCGEMPGPRDVTFRYSPHARRLKHGSIAKLVMSALRTAGEPLTARKILVIVTQLIGSKSREMAPRRLDNAIRGTLITKMNQGIVHCARSTGSKGQTYAIVGRRRVLPEQMADIINDGDHPSDDRLVDDLQLANPGCLDAT